jgi:hypothetical protein
MIRTGPESLTQKKYLQKKLQIFFSVDMYKFNDYYFLRVSEIMILNNNMQMMAPLKASAMSF